VSTSHSFQSFSGASSLDGSITSISEIDKYLGTDENGNSRVPEELRTLQDQLKTLQQADQSKNSQLQTKYLSEKKHWAEKAKGLQDQIAVMEQTLKTTQLQLRDQMEQNILLQDQFESLQQQFSELPAQTRAQAFERSKLKQQEQIKIRESQQALLKQIDIQKQQVVQLQQALERQRVAMIAVQKDLEYTKERSKEKISRLEKKLEETQSDIAKQMPSSNKELLLEQIKVLKTQRKVLVKEIKDLREQNDLLKSKIAGVK